MAVLDGIKLLVSGGLHPCLVCNKVFPCCDFTTGMCFPQTCTIDELHSLMLITLTTTNGVVIPPEDTDAASDRQFVTSGTWLVDFDCPTLDSSWSIADILGL